MHLPIRVRVTAAVAAAMVLLLAGVATIAYQSMAAALLDELDTGLRFRAVAALRDLDAVPAPDPRLQEPTESFEQVLTADGAVSRATPGFTTPLLTPAELSTVQGPTLSWRQAPHVAGRARILALRQGDTVLVVGASDQDRSDALTTLMRLLLIGGLTAIVLTSLVGWGVAGLAMRPVDRMRAQAAAITASGLDHRLSEPRTRDELGRLAVTLNQMLDRLESSVARERSFLAQAGHELRTPLAALRAEVDLALRRPRTTAELTAALRGVSTETDRLARLADDLLVLARAGDGRLPLHRQRVALCETLDSAGALFAARCDEHGVALRVSAPDTTIDVDPARLRQVLVNLIDNALRHSPPGGTVHLTGVVEDTTTHITITDDGPGFDPQPLSSGSVKDNLESGGLGLRIVAAIADAHHGHLNLSNGQNGGAKVQLVFPNSTG